MAYDRKIAGSGPQTLGFGGAAIDLAGGDYAVPDRVKAIVLIGEGDVVFRPVSGTEDIAIGGLPAGYVLPWHCSHIRAAGTTAALATVEG